MSESVQALAARVDLLSIVVQELGRALAPAQAAQVADAVRRRVGEMAESNLAATADEAITADLAPMLAALG